jgi:iron complex outermembrane recepter protein
VRYTLPRFLLITSLLVGIFNSQVLSSPEPSLRVDNPITIAAQPMAAAIQQLSKLSGIQFAYTSHLTDGLHSLGGGPSNNISEILKALLAGTDLGFKVVDAKTIAIFRLSKKRRLLDQSVKNLLFNETIDEVIVTAGYRKSLKKSLQYKRDYLGIADVVVATDIALFPDQNLAEALQRLPGVVIERDHGLGLTVNIRSLGTQFTHTTINGMTASSAAADRETQFDIFASELMQSATVSKSTTAAAEEGGISGTVALRTARPFDFSEARYVMSLEGAYGTLSEETDPRYAALISKTFADDSLGLLVSFIGEQRTHRSDSTQGRTWAALSTLGGYPEGIDPDNTFFQRRTKMRIWQFEEEKKGASLSIQYKPVDNFSAGIDVLLSNFERKGTNYNSGANIGREESIAESVTVVDGSVVAGHFSNVEFEAKLRNDIWETDYAQYNVYADWRNGSWSFKALAGIANSTQYYRPDSAHFTWRQTASVDYRVEGRYIVFSSPDFDVANDVSGYRYFQTSRFDSPSNDDKRALQLDFSRSLERPYIDTLKFGIKYSEQARSVITRNGRFTENADGSVIYAGSPMTNVDLVNASNFFPGGSLYHTEKVPVGLPTDLVMPDVDSLYALYVDPNNVPTRTNSSYRVNEDIIAAYLAGELVAQWGRFPVWVDLGVRYVRTDQFSQGLFVNDSIAETNRVSNQYNNWLPMLNVRVDLRDDLLLRIALGKAMSRATISDLSSRFIVNQERQEISAGNPTLKPYTAEQVDISLEYYYDESALLALGVFYKDLDTFIVGASRGNTVMFQGQPYDLRIVENAQGATLSGVEFSFQAPLTFLSSPFDGLGLNTNYTYLDTSAGKISSSGIAYDLEKLSKHSYNITLYYEKYGFDIRFSYNYRDDYVLEERNGMPIIIDGRGQLDISAGYQISDNIKLTFKAINATDEAEYQYSGVPDRPDVVRLLGSRVSFGVRATF